MRFIPVVLCIFFLGFSLQGIGQSLFLKQYVHTGSDFVQKGLIASDSSMYVCGATTEPSQVGIVPMMMKLDSIGTVLWASYFAPAGNGYMTDMIENHNGNIVAVGYGDDPTSGNSFGFILEITPSGTMIRMRAYKTDTENCFYTIQESSPGVYIVSGNSIDAWTFESIISYHKFNSNLNEVWTTGYSFLSQQPNFILDNVGNIYAIGTGWDHNNLHDLTYVMKLNHDGVTLWNLRLQGTTQDYFKSICWAPDSTLMLVYDEFSGSVHKDIVVKMDRSGNLIWAKEYYAQGFSGFTKRIIPRMNRHEFVLQQGNGNMYSIDSFGNILWQRKITSSLSQNIVDVAETQHSHLVSFGVVGFDKDVLVGKYASNGNLFCAQTNIELIAVNKNISFSAASLVFGYTNLLNSIPFGKGLITMYDSLLCNAMVQVPEVIDPIKYPVFYPNPFDFDLTISLPAEMKSGNVRITLRDIVGKTLVDKFVPHQDEIFVDQLDHIPSGIYLLTIQQNEKTFSRKLLKR